MDIKHSIFRLTPIFGKVAFLAIIFFTTLPVFAQNEAVTVRVDGRSLFRVGAAGETSAATRAAQIERRLTTLLQNPQAIAPAVVQVQNETRVITVAAVPVVTIAASDAQENLTDIDALAAQWAQSINAALTRGRENRETRFGRFSSEIQASVETAFARLLESAITIVPRFLAALLVIGLFWAIAAGVRALMRIIFRRIVEDLTVENLIKQVAYYAVWALGLIVAADALGFDPQTVVTGLGLTGLALGFALKDIISNFISGILILILRPFELGDQIVVGDTEGSVERIELRATQIRNYDGRVVIVPNADIFTSRITNNTTNPVRRGSVEMFIGYDSDLRTAIKIMETAAQTAEGVLEEPKASVRIHELGADDIILEVRFWTDSRRSDFVATTSNVRENVIEKLKTAEIGLPNPAERKLVLQNTADWREAFGE